MPISRRDFMKLFGIGVASMLMTRCRVFPPVATCYAPMPPTPEVLTPRDRLRQYWISFGELAQRTQETGNTENTFGRQLVADHRLALDELVASGELSAPVAALIQEAYDAAVYHVWRSNVPMTCYEPMMVDYAPVSASVLVQQSDILDDFSGQGTIDPETLAKAQAAIEHDMAFFALSDADVQALYAQILKASQEQGQPIPSFEDLQLEVTADAKAAAQFIIDLLTGK
ncbi:MAG: hypothetical protein FD146_2615 [Anaerolineaceae bacterium]|nr:MAG: hypothetical protein FD146_2615 [Anaerolineaceae bacterium]